MVCHQRGSFRALRLGPTFIRREKSAGGEVVKHTSSTRIRQANKISTEYALLLWNIEWSNSFGSRKEMSEPWKMADPGPTPAP